MSSKGKIPKLVVFDLDYTLWPFWVDTHVNPPFRKTNGKIVDSSGKTIKFYPEVPQVLQKLTEMNIPIGVASRTSEIQGAEQLCELFDWNKYFKYKEIYPGSKDAHFNQFKKYTDFEFEDMLFFDDELRNIRDLTKLNVTSILVKNGMTLKVLEDGLQIFANKKTISFIYFTDLTLWPFHVDDYQFPFTKDRLGIVRDACECELALYSETKEVLENLRINNIKMAVASRITDVASAYQLLYLFELRKYFVCTEIYPTRKSLHFVQLKKKTNIDYNDMIFFDDDVRNLKCVEKLGVEVHQVVDGISANHVQFG